RFRQMGARRRHGRPGDRGWRAQGAALRRNRGRNSERRADRCRAQVRPAAAAGAEAASADAATGLAAGSGPRFTGRSAGAAGVAERVLEGVDLGAVRHHGPDQYAGGAGVIRIKGTNYGLAMALDGNGRWCQLDPRAGARLAAAEAARKVACAGARPMAATNCLNFGNPEKPEVMWQLAEAIAGLGEACRALGTPVT